MASNLITSRGVIGKFYARLEQAVGAEWTNPLSMYIPSDQASENYAWLGQSPTMREWVGGRLAKKLREQDYTIKNKKYESTLEINCDDVRRDKTGQIDVRINDQADRANAHWAKLLSTLIANGASADCYDGKYFFDDDHSEGDSGTQDNDLTYTVSTAANPSAAEMEAAIMQAVQAIMGFKDDQGEPMNENAHSFRVMVPVNMMAAAAAALKNPVIVDSNGSRTNTITNIGGFQFELDVNARLTGTSVFYVFRADGVAKPFIRQEEVPIKLSAVAEGSELEFNEDIWRFGIMTIRNVGYGLWQHAVMTTFST